MRVHYFPLQIKESVSMPTEFIADPINKIRTVAAESERKVAAIAYVTKDHGGFGEFDIVICDASDSSIKSRSTCRDLLRQWFDAGVLVYSKATLHAKTIVFDHESAFVGSANLSEFAERRIECGIYTTEPIVVAECENFILGLTEVAELVEREFLDRLDKLILKPREPENSNSEAMRPPRLKYWFFKGTTELPKKALEDEESMRSKWNEGAAEETTEDYEDEIPEDENPLSFHGLRHNSTRWVNGISKGDRVFWCYEDDDYGWIVLPPRTATSIESKGRSIMAGTEGRYWDEEESIRLSVFIEQLGLRKNVSLDAIASSNPRLIQLLGNWDNLID